MYRFSLSARDTEDVLVFVDELATHFAGVEDETFLQQAAVLAHELPRSLRLAMHDVRLNESHGAIVVSGYPLDDARIGPTPLSWGMQEASRSTRREEIFFFLCGALLGDAIAWRTQQTGRVMHDVLPIPGHENVQLNSASDMQIYWHIEDAFHVYRADYVGLMCLRNNDSVATTYATLDVEALPQDAVRTLFEPRFLVRPDNSHGSASAFTEEPARIAVLFGDPAAPYLRLDPYFMDPGAHDPVAWEALDVLGKHLETNLHEVALHPGEVLFVDNYRAVHGRNSFRANYDGRDRWLKRLNVARDLRKSRAARSAPADRVIGTFDMAARKGT
ncbi:guanitoxin biosynthesis L-enduracididine beta-hydroxylase GntD [Streptomyces sp. NPDC012461]|uniref:TauD/TfdA-like domain-containing protein n=2 Tax=unclassified Streptomyces TaxID=2593676 RepID=A0A6G3R1U5_9ACTN|nr:MULTISPECIES: guanitoxin biosynthesis L-enduracididine beta-hydroxylase GntD [unclassified Streptomyces]NEA89434.1 hypothetical protein [Streptomyces sp. SID14436]NEC81656.1 hypothetical protein [Streptomyces sp. SID7958]